jgi:hypothetical protein
VEAMLAMLSVYSCCSEHIALNTKAASGKCGKGGRDMSDRDD